VKDVKFKISNHLVASLKKLKLVKNLNGLFANQEVKEWSRLDRMELWFSKDVIVLLRVA